MPSFSDLPKAYDPAAHEDEIYAAWEASGAFQPQGKGEPYCIVMPPPNRTGTLHMGHATMLAIEDLMIRFARMQGKRALWIPGTDHAAIATQVKVEQLLVKQGIKDPRRELGREKFLEKVVEFAEDSAKTIRAQVRKMGSSCDWTQEKYTLDEDRNRAVNAVFKMMFEDGIIERGYRVVNWDPQFQTTLSDDEVENKETTARLITFKYDADFPIAISTTRPETKFGDTAVAVHPDDERYKQYVGKTFTPIFCGKKLMIRVIADKAADPAFGTGALGVTPAHSMIDAEMAERHGLETVPVIDKNAQMIESAVGDGFGGLAIVEARKKIEAMLQAQGLLEKVEEVAQALPVAQRGGAVVEQLPMRQWFIRVNKPFVLRQDTLGKWKKGEKATLKELMRYAVESGQTTIVPERFVKVHYHWVDNLRDWCISRQIWFGHRVPVWYRENGKGKMEKGTGMDSDRGNDKDETTASDVSPGAGWEQDPDTLDTWFSSGLWTFSTLGWPPSVIPSKAGIQSEWDKMREFHPTAVLETGYDILPFWVARMILMSTYALGEVPFKDVYLHGLVRDEQGRKMSKSLGNVIDPLDVIPKYGTDAVRLSLVMGTTPGQDVKLSEPKIEGFRNFTNKLWNISRFILMQLGESGLRYEPPTLKTDADHWIFAHLSNTVFVVNDGLEKYEFSRSGEMLRSFTWTLLADSYLEFAKFEGNKENNLSKILVTILKLWHPFMPFVTERIWQVAGQHGLLISEKWPDYDELRNTVVKLGLDKSRANDFNIVIDLIAGMRLLKSEVGIEAASKVDYVIDSPSIARNTIQRNLSAIEKLVRASSLKLVDDIPSGYVSKIMGTITVGIKSAGAIDVAKERAKIEKEIAETQAYIAATSAKLANKEFASKAPPHVVEGMKAKLAEAVQRLEALKGRLASLQLS